MIQMIASSQFAPAESKANFPSDAKEPETDEFAALLSGLTFAVPPVVAPQVNLPAQSGGEAAEDSQIREIYADGAAQPLPQFDESIVLPEDFAQLLPESFSQIFLKTGAPTGEKTNEQLPHETKPGEVSATSIEQTEMIKTAEKEATAEFQQMLRPNLAGSQFAGKPALKSDLKTGANSLRESEKLAEKSADSKPHDPFLSQIENIEAATGLKEDNTKSISKLTESRLSSANLADAKSESPNKLPKLFREVSNFFDVAETHIKTSIATHSEPAQTAAAGGKDIAAQLEPQILQLAMLAAKSNKPQILRMRLNPAELGAVEIKIEKDAAGKLNAHFQTEKEETRKILTESLTQLKDSLQNSGWQVERVELSCGSFSFAGNEAREQSSQAQQHTVGNSSRDTNSDGSPISKDETNSDKSNRLLSVRA